MSETDLQRAIVRALEQAGHWAFRVNSGHFRGAGGHAAGAPPGTPDVCVVDPPGWLEVKLPGGEIRSTQRQWHDEAARRGVRVTVVTSVREAIDCVAGWERDCQLEAKALQSVNMSDSPGARLREARKGAGLTLRSVAESAGVSVGYVSQLENGERNGSINLWRRLAEAVGADPKRIAFGEEP